ncbi:hypothetical protein OSB04_018454 [Centaurea solstitialis]|uniref:Uncharacterized protein n=1 Tax=Centaurea solstitialis TaxID=347529 RepID=A0AA38T6L2_9ASTR|nr:hypothetical protein OSB04_018454 [Centaurea solstitialis]
MIRCINTVEKCLSYARIERTSVNEVILTGGSTRYPKCNSCLCNFSMGERYPKGYPLRRLLYKVQPLWLHG